MIKQLQHSTLIHFLILSKILSQWNFLSVNLGHQTSFVAGAGDETKIRYENYFEDWHSSCI